MIKSWVINVKSSKRKKLFFISEAKKCKLDFKFFEAVTPQKLYLYDYISDPNIQQSRFARPLMPTEVACAISHISLWKKLIDDKNADYYCIFEDDTYLDKNLSKFLLHPKLTNVDLIKFSGLKKVPFKKVIALDEKYSLVKLAYGPLDAAAYRISKNAAKTLVNYTYNLTHPIDIMLDRSYEHGVTIHALLPYLCNTDWHFDPKDPLFTDIGLREHKYLKGTSFFSIIKTRFFRTLTSYKKRIAHLKLLFTR